MISDSMLNMINQYISKFVDYINSKRLTIEKFVETWLHEENQQMLKEYIESIKNLQYSYKPKGLRSGYIYFSIDKRQEIKKEFPNMKNNDVIKQLSIEWKKLKETVDKDINIRKKLELYQKKAIDDKKRLAQEIIELKNRKKSFSILPRASHTEWSYFCEKKIASFSCKHPDLNNDEIIKRLYQAWKKEKKNKTKLFDECINFVKEDKKRFNTEMIEYITKSCSDITI